MRTRILIISGIILVGILVYLGVTVASYHHFQSTSSDEKQVDLRKTTWEIVEYTEGSKVENLVGTDWVLQFGQSDGFLRLCDTHPFSYYIYKQQITFDFEKKTESSCQKNLRTSESVFYDLLTQHPTVARTAFNEESFKEVLTFTHGNQKLVLVPRESIGVSKGLRQAQLVNISTEVCPLIVKSSKNQSPCNPLPYEGAFTVQLMTTDASPAPMTVQTTALGLGTVSLPVGTYQLSLEHPDATVRFSPMIFSIADIDTKPLAIVAKLEGIGPAFKSN